MDKKLIYIAHPFGGDVNVKACEDLVRKLTTNCNNSYVFISPVLNFGHMYVDVDYIDGVNVCLDLLNACDGLLLANAWQTSRGCMAEYAFARAKGITIFSLKDFNL